MANFEAKEGMECFNEKIYGITAGFGRAVFRERAAGNSQPFRSA